MRGIVVVVFFALVKTAGAQGDFEADRATLKGLQGVEVTVEGLRPEAVEDGLTQDQLQTDVELRLRKVGIRVLTKEEKARTPGSPWLYVRVNTLRGDTGLYAYSIEVDLYQTVLLERDSSISTTTPTWATSTIATVGARGMPRSVRGSVGDKVDQFVNAYLAMNPITRR